MTEMSRLRSASLDMTGLRLYCPPTYLTNEAPGLMPVACPRTIDNRGIELITRDGQMPVYLDSGQVFWGSG
jgi:hypothetical protein